jgi:tRNA/rRNA methyltransferase
MSDRVNIDNISIVLLQPRYSENIGAAARAMRNMGFQQLVIVDPQNFDLSKALKLATHFAADIIENSHFFPNFEEALSPFNYVAGTTARLGGQRQVVCTPLTLARKLIPISAKNRVAILFGPEDKGLSNGDIRYCHTLVNIPTTQFSSLNLAQSVMILCYEIFMASQEAGEEFTPRMASRHELDGMYDQLKDILVRISYINSENPDYWLNQFRRFFTRLQLRAKEVNIIRGLCRQVDWYGKKCYENGRKERIDS